MRVQPLIFIMSLLGNITLGSDEGVHAEEQSVYSLEELERKYPLDPPKNNPLIYRIAKTGNLEDCKTLHRLGYDKTNIRSKKGFYPSHAAATSANPKSIFWLAENGYGDLTATPNRSNHFMPIHYLLCNPHLSLEELLDLAQKIDLDTRKKALANKQVFITTLKKVKDHHGSEASFILAALLCEGHFTFKPTSTDFQNKLRMGVDPFLSSTESCCCKEFLAFILFILQEKYYFMPFTPQENGSTILQKAKTCALQHDLLPKVWLEAHREALMASTMEQQTLLQRFINFDTAYKLGYDKNLKQLLDLDKHDLSLSIVYFIRTAQQPGLNDFDEIAHFALLANINGKFHFIHQPEPSRYKGRPEGVKVERAQEYIEKWIRKDKRFWGLPSEEHLYSYMRVTSLANFLEKTQKRCS